MTQTAVMGMICATQTMVTVTKKSPKLSLRDSNIL